MVCFYFNFIPAQMNPHIIQQRLQVTTAKQRLKNSASVESRSAGISLTQFSEVHISKRHGSSRAVRVHCSDLGVSTALNSP